MSGFYNTGSSFGMKSYYNPPQIIGTVSCSSTRSNGVIVPSDQQTACLNTSVVFGLLQQNSESFEQQINSRSALRHIDYEQNPKPVSIQLYSTNSQAKANNLFENMLLSFMHPHSRRPRRPDSATTPNLTISQVYCEYDKYGNNNITREIEYLDKQSILTITGINTQFNLAAPFIGVYSNQGNLVQSNYLIGDRNNAPDGTVPCTILSNTLIEVSTSYFPNDSRTLTFGVYLLEESAAPTIPVPSLEKCVSFNYSTGGGI
jgi:hypothetical protein